MRRDDFDFWPTPFCLRLALTAKVLPTLPPGPVWEAAAGDGYLVDAIAAAGRSVIASDINPQRGDIARLDFLNDPPLPRTESAVLVTNPPFGKSGLLDPFLSRIMILLDNGHLTAAVLLLRADHTGTDGRAALINRAVAQWTCCWRPIWIPGSPDRGRWWFQWVVWVAGRYGPPINTHLTHGDLPQLI